jgi:zinc protease
MPKVDSLMTEILGEFVKKGVTPVEVTETAKGWLEDRKVDRSSDSSVARTLAAQLFLGRTYERTIKLEKTVSELTADQVNAAIRRYLDPSRFYIVEAGDFAKKQ